MSKYNYDKSVLKGLSVGPFMSEVKVREAHIAKAPEKEIEAIYNENIVAAALHPDVQYAIISSVKDEVGAKTFTFVPDVTKGTDKLAYFRAGQYVSVLVDIAGTRVTKPYTLQSNPKDALDDCSYSITVKKNANGYASAYILDKWKEGDSVAMSGPLGQFYYQSLRDARHVVAVAGGSGITPFISMAAAIVSGIEDFDLTILYGSRTASGILLREQLENLAGKSKGRVRVVHVLSDEEIPEYEHGFITAELIRKYAGDGDYSIYACGPKAMYDFLANEVAKLNLPARRARFEVPGEFGDPASAPDYPRDAIGKTFSLHIIARDKEYTTTCRANQTLVNACESAGVGVTTDCRSGICGWCHSRLISGQVYIPATADGRREADKKFGWIHPCATYPLSDVTLEVFPSM